MWHSGLMILCTAWGVQPHQARHKRRQAPILPLHHQLELRFLASGGIPTRSLSCTWMQRWCAVHSSAHCRVHGCLGDVQYTAALIVVYTDAKVMCSTSIQTSIMGRTYWSDIHFQQQSGTSCKPLRLTNTSACPVFCIQTWEDPAHLDPALGVTVKC